MLIKALQQLGLGERDIEVYLALVKQPAVRPSALAGRMRLPRTTIQNVLLRLERHGLVMRDQSDRALAYSAVHPENLLVLLQGQKNQAIAHFARCEEELQRIIPEITGMMHSAKSIPQVRFFRGRDGAREVLFDTLTSKTQLKDFANIDAMFEVIQDINNAYVAEREKTKITKRSLLLDTPFARQIYESGRYSPRSHKGYKWIPGELYPFSIEMNIYDGKISYLTYIREELIGVIVENDYIYQMHDSIWNLLWDMLPEPVLKAKTAKNKRCNK